MNQSKVLVAGTGISGIAAARLVLERGGEVVLYDGNTALDPAEIRKKFKSGKGQFVPAFTRFNLVFSFTVRNPAYTFTLVLYSDIHQGFVGEGVCYDTFNLCGCADRGKQKQQKKDKSRYDQRW